MTGNKIIFKRNSVSGSIPALSSLSAGEIAINPVDGKIFLKQTTIPGNPNFDRIVTFVSNIDQPYVFDSNLSAVYINYGNNAVNQVFSTILGGLFNINSGAGSTIVNGDNNKVYSDISFIGNGYNNAIYLSGAYSSILNGENNTITLSGDHSAILGGLNNTINHKNTFILGSNITTTQENCTYVNRLYSLSGIEVGTSKPVSDLYISENGNVGIKTETPNVDLTVEGSISGRNIYADNIFVNNNLTVTNTVSAKYYQGTLLDWMTLVRGYKTYPTLLATIGTGEVFQYVYSTTGADITYYRYVATDGSEDSFYGNFTNPTLSNLIVRRAIIL